jgi:hypothetical protein
VAQPPAGLGVVGQLYEGAVDGLPGPAGVGGAPRPRRQIAGRVCADPRVWVVEQRPSVGRAIGARHAGELAGRDVSTVEGDVEGGVGRHGPTEGEERAGEGRLQRPPLVRWGVGDQSIAPGEHPVWLVGQGGREQGDPGVG